MLRWLEHEPRFDVVSLPFTLLIGLARPLREALGAPIVCTLQGEDLFLDSLHEPWKSQALRSDSAADRRRRLFIAVSEYYADFMPRYLGIPARSDPRRAARHQHRRARRRSRRGATPPYTIGFFARIAPEKGLHVLADAYRRLRARPGVPDDAAARRRLPARRASRVPRRRSSGRCSDWGLGGSLPLCRRARSRRQDRAAAADGRVLDAGDLRRAEGPLAARGDGQRRAGRAAAPRRVPRDRRAHRRRRAGRRRTIPTRSPTRSWRCSSIASAPPRSAAPARKASPGTTPLRRRQTSRRRFTRG